MSQIIESILADVCLDERIKDGIFHMDEEFHMDALRDHLIKRGLTREASIHVTNRMVEGKYPERQAYRSEDGILVTWPSPKHMDKAFRENPGKYVRENPNPTPPRDREKEPVKEPVKREVPKDDIEPKEQPKDDSSPRPVGNIFDREPSKVIQGDKQLDIEPARGSEPPVTSPATSAIPTTPKTPERIAAEKEVVNQIFSTDDHSLANISPSLSETCRRQLNELYKKADELGYQEAITFLTPYVKS